MIVGLIERNQGDDPVAPERADCSACSGSRYYDALGEDGEPIPCGACEGTGKEGGPEADEADEWTSEA